MARRCKGERAPLPTLIGNTIDAIGPRGTIHRLIALAPTYRVQIGNLMPNSKKKTPAARREYTRDDLKALKAHSKAKTPIAKISKQLKRTVPALRAKAHQLGIGLGHQR
jgi:hypothetical protein